MSRSWKDAETGDRILKWLKEHEFVRDKAGNPEYVNYFREVTFLASKLNDRNDLDMAFDYIFELFEDWIPQSVTQSLFFYLVSLGIGEFYARILYLMDGFVPVVEDSGSLSDRISLLSPDNTQGKKTIGHLLASLSNKKPAAAVYAFEMMKNQRLWFQALPEAFLSSFIQPDTNRNTALLSSGNQAFQRKMAEALNISSIGGSFNSKITL